MTPEALAAAADRLDPIPFRRAEHVVSENARVEATVAALAAGDLAAVGRLFAESHASLRDRFEVSSPELDAMVEIAVAVPGVIAARMTGAGFGGCTVNLVRPDAIDALRAAVETDYPARTGLTPMVLPGRRRRRRRTDRLTRDGSGARNIAASPGVSTTGRTDRLTGCPDVSTSRFARFRHP